MAESENIGGNSQNFFEGVEKLLEIWFKDSDNSKNADLRKIPRSEWETLLETVHCAIILSRRYDQIDSYVLSESSMFVSKNRWILKTCGTTTPLQCLQPLLELVKKWTGYDEVENLFYSRKDFKHPEWQKSPHRGFQEEVAFLNQYYVDGQPYVLGKANGECWYLYTVNRGGGGSISKATEQMMLIENYDDDDVDNDQKLRQHSVDPDQTIEVLMTELDPKVMSIFTMAECAEAKEAREKSGIHKIIPDMVIDDHIFDPHGYSMNGVLKNGCYMTIHITPEEEFSYVSFESNIAASSYNDLIKRVIETFNPGKFLVTILANKTSPAASARRDLKHLSAIGEWKRHDIDYCHFDTYDLTYAHYCKFPS